MNDICQVRPVPTGKQETAGRALDRARGDFLREFTDWLKTDPPDWMVDEQIRLAPIGMRQIRDIMGHLQP